MQPAAAATAVLNLVYVLNLGTHDAPPDMNMYGERSAGAAQRGEAERLSLHYDTG
eukprot:SAG31_NODE_9174_length_1321_cov_2.220131_1_plen_55_part_00